MVSYSFFSIFVRQRIEDRRHPGTSEACPVLRRPVLFFLCIPNHTIEPVKNLLVCLLPFLFAFYSDAEGLYFRSYEVDKDSRTTLNLTPDQEFSLEKGFTLDFDLKLRREIHNFGYIFRLIVGDRQNLDLIVRATPPNRVYFLVAGNENKLTFTGKNILTDDAYWTHITVSYSKNTDELSLKIDDTEQKTNLGGLFPSLRPVKISFGEVRHPVFSTTDVAPMTLKDIRLTRTGGPSYLWRLGKHGENEVFDENRGRRATVTRPAWLIDRKACWEKETSLATPHRYFWAFNEGKSEIYLAGPRRLYVYNTALREFTDTIDYKKGSCFYSNAAQLLFDSGAGRLLSYEIDSNAVECFDFTRRSWKNHHTTPSAPDFWHHNRFISAADSSLYCFGGYGHHRYKGTLKSYSFGTGRWSEQDLGASVSPRYLAALGQGKEKVYLFGGYGSPTGEQAVSPRYFYDLYEIDPARRQVKKRWEYNNRGVSFVQGNSMVVNEEAGCFYTLCYSSEKYRSCIYLNRFSLDKPARTVLADSIPFVFNDTESMCDLFLDKKNGRFVALVLTPGPQRQHEIGIYTLGYPPVLHSEVFQTRPRPYGLYAAGGLSAAVLLISSFLLYRKRRRRKTPVATVNEGDCREQPASEVVPSAARRAPAPEAIPPKASSILLLGGFQVIGREGNDITGSFTPTLKNLLVLLLLHPLARHKGVSSEIIIERFWYDKSGASARNNLSVNIKRLRSLLEQTGPVQVTHTNGYWTIEPGAGVTCDYREARGLLEAFRERSYACSAGEIARLLARLAAGPLLPAIRNEWVDEYKAEYNDLAIETLWKLLSGSSLADADELRLKICDVLLMFDSLNEEGMAEKCRVLYRLGRKGQAKNVYDTYCKNYSVFLNADFKVPFSKIICKDDPGHK